MELLLVFRKIECGKKVAFQKNVLGLFEEVQYLLEFEGLTDLSYMLIKSAEKVGKRIIFIVQFPAVFMLTKKAAVIRKMCMIQISVPFLYLINF